MNKHSHIIDAVAPGSIAEELNIEPGDELLTINGKAIEDIFDAPILHNTVVNVKDMMDEIAMWLGI